jgi:hypothetical protein
MTAYVDVTRGNIAGRKDSDGWQELTTLVVVDGLSGSTDQILDDALIASGVPRMGQLHPSKSVLEVDELRPKAVSGSVVEITVVYRNKGDTDSPEEVSGTIRIGTSLQSVTSNDDHEGKLIVVTHGTVTQAADVPRQVPQSTIHVSRRESASPGYKSQKYVGKVNAANQFALAGENAAARTWMCTAITGQSSDGAKTFDVDYEFAYNEKTWDVARVIFRGADGRTPIGILDPLGNIQIESAVKTNVQIYTEANFNDLQLGGSR